MQRMVNQDTQIERRRWIWPLAAAGFVGLITSITALPAIAGVLEERVDPAAVVLAQALAADELEGNRAAGVGAAPILGTPQSQDVAVILWDELNRNGGIISAGDENVNVSVTVNY